jgi:hypothetical protein
MQYGITRTVMSCERFLEISPNEFELGKMAARSLAKVLDIEQKLNIVLDNYFEFESELMLLSLQDILFAGRTWSSFQTERDKINRRLINLLTTCRLYEDQILHNVNSIYGTKLGKAALVKKRMSQEYDSNLGCRVLKALRNYVQHRALPIYHLTYGRSRLEYESGPHGKHTITPTLSVAKLKEEGGFKRSVLKELEAEGNLIDLKPLIRLYMESIGRLHLFIRDLLADDISKWDSKILEIQKSFRDGSAEDQLGLVIVSRDDEGTTVESIFIIEDVIKYRKWLTRKNRSLTRYNFHFVSSESKRLTDAVRSKSTLTQNSDH